MFPSAETTYAQLVETGPEAVVVADADGIIRIWNDAAERLFGYTRAEAVGASLDLIIPEPQRARHWSGYRTVMHTGETRYSTDLLAVPALRKDGTRISVEFAILPLRDRAGRTLGIAATLRDVTRRFEEMKALRAALAAKPQRPG